MKKGDIYTKHVRGSKYGFNRDGIFYKYPSDQKCYCKNVDESLLEDLIEIKGHGSGRFIINEIGEIVIRKKRDNEEVWEPRYVGKLKEEMKFEDIYVNPHPNLLKPGLLWTGFCSHHGGEFSINRNKRPFFKEKIKENHSENTKTYFIQNLDEEILKRIIKIKSTGTGRFRVNEYGHVWSPVKNENIEYQMKNDEFKEAFTNQFDGFPSKLKRTIKRYQKHNHTPIYMGRIDGELKINRQERPHLVYSRDDLLDFDYDDVDLEYYD